MQQQLDQVKTFHVHIGAEISDQPRLLENKDTETQELAQRLRRIIAEFQFKSSTLSPLVSRSLMALEEHAEWLEAHAADDLTAAMDAWADRCYLLLGDAIATGIPAEESFAAVHRSNMTKFGRDPETGKGVKATGYLRPALNTNDE
jgi:predicted HAD superfamily Cof-like phosphohydrolase